MPKQVPEVDAVMLRRVAALYEGGSSIRAIAARMSWSYGVAHSRVHAAAAAGHVTVRGRGGRANKR